MRSLLYAAPLVLLLGTPAQAHFGIVLPDPPMLEQGGNRTIGLTIGFAHPFEPSGLELVEPSAVAVTTPEGTTDLLPALEPSEFHGAGGFSLSYAAARPGVHVFHMEPEPYWEPAEDVFIVHYTKVYVPAFGDDEGWDAELGLPIEIVPLSRPFGLWAGNVFQGIVKRDGAPLPGAEIEVEFYNADAGVAAPADLMVTQTVRADAAGVFTYAAPAAGWWGFAALDTSDEEMEQGGLMKDVEIGGVLWVHFTAWPGSR